MSIDKDGGPLFLIQNGFNLRELAERGSALQIFNEDQDHEPDNNSVGTIPPDTLGQHNEASFEELATEMQAIDEFGYVKKKILEEGGGEVIDGSCIVRIGYSAYWEKESKPFDLRPPIKPLECDMQESHLLPGLHTAVLSMRVGEISMFLLSYNVMYGKMGNPPAIKPAADCLFYVKLVRSHLTSDIRKSLSQQNVFARSLKESKTLYTNAVKFYNTSNIPMAIRCFNKAVHIMHSTRLADEQEEKKQESFLLKVYLNLATCYNQSRNPRRACCMCNEIHRLQNIWHNGKALYQNARALRMIGDFNGAEKKLKRAMNLCPDMCKEMEQEMNSINMQRKVYDKSKFVLKLQQDGFVSEDFKKEVTKLVKQFVEDQDICKITLPKARNSDELKYIEDLAKQYKLNSAVVKDDLSLDKMPLPRSNESMFGD